MNKITVKFQHPFREQEEELTCIDNRDIIDSFLNIDWKQLTIDIFEKHDDILHDFYFFEVSYLDDLSFENRLNISGVYTYGEQLNREGPSFDIFYQRPVERTSRGFLGMQPPRTKTVVDSIKMVECTKQDVIDSLQAFLDNDQAFLQKIGTNEIQWGS